MWTRMRACELAEVNTMRCTFSIPIPVPNVALHAVVKSEADVLGRRYCPCPSPPPVRWKSGPYAAPSAFIIICTSTPPSPPPPPPSPTPSRTSTAAPLHSLSHTYTIPSLRAHSLCSPIHTATRLHGLWRSYVLYGKGTSTCIWFS
jgi:hypothetical protein